MPSIQLILCTLLGLAGSIFGIARLFERPDDGSRYLFLFLASGITFFLIRLIWQSWQDIKECRAKANAGDRDAMYELSQLLLPTSRMSSLDWAEKAAALGHRVASFRAGYLRYGMGFRGRETFDYFLSAAERGHEPAMRAVADCYKLGHCVLPNDRLSFEWRFKSATSYEARFDPMCRPWQLEEEDGKAPGYVCSQDYVGMCYLRGEGCERNVVEAFAWFLLAARSKHSGAISMIRELDRRKAYKLRALMQDRSLQISNALEQGGVVEPGFVSPTDVPFSVVGGGQGDTSMTYPGGEPAQEPVSAWRAFFTVFLSGNLLMSFLLVASKSSGGSPIRPEINGPLYGGFIAAAIVAALYGRRLHPALDLLLLAATSVAAASTLAFWGSPSTVLTAAGAALAAGAIVIPGSVILIHWRHPISTYLFYALVVIHSIGVIPAMLV
jgi:hypothetical protein